MRGSADISYLGRTVDKLIWDFMDKKKIPGLTLAIVQAPYIPRVAGYGVSDAGERRLASPGTMWPAGPISQGFTAVAVMQLYEDGLLDIQDQISAHISALPDAWKEITILQLLHHASGLADYRTSGKWSPYKEWDFQELVALVSGEPLHFTPGTEVEQSATNFLLLTEIIESVSGKTYHDFIWERQIEYMNLKQTGFAEDLDKFPHEDVSKSGNIHQLFKSDGLYINPIEPAASYDTEGTRIPGIHSSALKGFSDIWASAQDISRWDIGLAGSVLIHEPENRAIVYAPWKLPDGREVPASAGWQFYRHRGLMDIKGSVPGYSCFLSRFTHAEELVCVTLLANKEGIDFTNLARKIAGAFGDLMSTNYDDNQLYLLEGQFSVEETVARLEKELAARQIPLFAKFDHAENARGAGLSLRPTTVLVFGSPKVGTGLMQADQSIALELPLRIAVWEDEAHSTWLAFPELKELTARYGVDSHPAVAGMQRLLEELLQRAAFVY